MDPKLLSLLIKERRECRKLTDGFKAACMRDSEGGQILLKMAVFYPFSNGRNMHHLSRGGRYRPLAALP
jgi:hypothetical protein